jgi:hypothetical protein
MGTLLKYCSTYSFPSFRIFATVVPVATQDPEYGVGLPSGDHVFDQGYGLVFRQTLPGIDLVFGF